MAKIRNDYFSHNCLYLHCFHYLLCSYVRVLLTMLMSRNADLHDILSAIVEEVNDTKAL